MAIRRIWANSRKTVVIHAIVDTFDRIVKSLRYCVSQLCVQWAADTQSVPIPADVACTESVVADDEGVRLYDPFRGVFQIEWHQVREVAAEWIVQAYAPIPYATITGDSMELIIQEGCKGFPALLDRLAELPGFPSKKFSKALKDTLYDEKVVVWRRSVAEPNAAADPVS